MDVGPTQVWGSPLRAQDTPSFCNLGAAIRGFGGQYVGVVKVIRQLRRSPSPPAVIRNAKLPRIVQPRANWRVSN